MPIEMDSQGLFGTALVKALNEKNISARDLAIRTESSYEHIRKLIKGLASPSRRMLRDICAILDLSFEQMSLLTTQDKVQRRYGEDVDALVGRPTGCSEFDELVLQLTPEQREMFKIQMRAVARSNQAVGGGLAQSNATSGSANYSET